MSSGRLACILGNDQMHNMILNSPTQNVLTRIYEKTRLPPDMGPEERKLYDGDRCLLHRNFEKIREILKRNIFLFGERKTADLLLTLLFLFDGLFEKFWISEKFLQEYNQVIYYNGGKPRLAKT